MKLAGQNREIGRSTGGPTPSNVTSGPEVELLTQTALSELGRYGD